MVEIETDNGAADLKRLWTLSRETLCKTGCSGAAGGCHWDIDFFKTDDGRTYFALAEVEMPEHEREPPDVPLRLAGHLLGAAPLGDARFTSKRLADQAHAERLLLEIPNKGTGS